MDRLANFTGICISILMNGIDPTTKGCLIEAITDQRVNSSSEKAKFYALTNQLKLLDKVIFGAI